MAISVTWPTPSNGFVGTIFVPKADTTLVSAGPPEIRQINVNTLRGDVGLLYASSEGAYAYNPFVHVGEITTGGFTYARQVSFLYRVQFEAGAYVVNTFGANHNILDVIVDGGLGPSVKTQNSAGLVNVQQLYILGYLGSVWVDVANGVSGTEIQLGHGTPAVPVNNIADALTLAASIPLRKITIVNGSITQPSALEDYVIDLHAGVTWDLNGQSADRTTFSGFGSTVTGAGTGTPAFEEVILDNVSGVEFLANDCRITSNGIVLGAGASKLVRCSSNEPGTGSATIDMGGSGASLISRFWGGGAQLINKTGSESATFDIQSGALTIANTVTNGVIVARGVGVLTHTQTGTEDVQAQGLLSPAAQSAMLYGSPAGPAIHFDSFNGVSGTDVNVHGTADNPVNNEADMYTLALALGYKRCYLQAGTIELESGSVTAYWDWHFQGTGAHTGVSCGDIGGGRPAKNLWGVTMRNTSVLHDINPDNGPGTNEGADLVLYDCFVGPCTGITGQLFDCTIHSTLSLPNQLINVANSAGGLTLTNCAATNSEQSPSRIDFVGGVSFHYLNVQGFRGKLVLQNVKHVDDDIEISVDGGVVEFDASCTVQPTIPPRLRGDYEFINNSALTDFNHGPAHKALDLVGVTGKVVEHKRPILGGANGYQQVDPDGVVEQDIPVRQVDADTVRLNDP